jgi:alpha-L-fucosidase
MKILLFSLIFLGFYTAEAQSYTPVAENLESRKEFQDMKFGMFIHWGPFSIPGSGEWVMNNRNISVGNYTRLEKFFNPINFRVEDYVSLAKKSGMKYITLITRHHDGFSMWNTQYSDFNIMNGPYKQDIVKLFADECHKQGIKLFLYYSLLDWRREDYSYWTGNTGQGTGRTHKGNWPDYIQFMKNQLRELLTNYGKIDGIWFDGYWDQVNEDPKTKVKTLKVDWHMEEIYALIHSLQPQCLIGNNHHSTPLSGEDFQMFEKDLPGGNTTGFGGASASSLPLETCETMNDSWGFNITDTKYKSFRDLIHYMVHSAGMNANFLLNIGPMPNGEIQPEFVDTLHKIGSWIDKYGITYQNTRGADLGNPNWGSITKQGNTLYIHIFSFPKDQSYIELSGIREKVLSLNQFDTHAPVPFSREKGNLRIELAQVDKNPDDTILTLKLK